MGRCASAVAVLLAAVSCRPAAADIYVINDEINSTVTAMEDAPSLFGPGTTSSGISGPLMVSRPILACTPLDVAPPAGSARRWMLLIERGNCTFEEKVWNAQRAGFRVAIVFNVNSDAVSAMHGDGSRAIHIPSFFVGQSNGLMLTRFTNATLYHLHITNKYPFDFADYLIPFAVVIAVCFIVLVGIMVYRCYADHRRTTRHRLPRRALQSLPTRKFDRETDPYDTCAICLDDYEDGVKLRILPCNHAYHAECVDPWLTRSKRVCPVCKRRVLATESDSDSDEETPADHEWEPLLEPRARRSYGAVGAPAGAGTEAEAATPATSRMRPSLPPAQQGAGRIQPTRRSQRSNRRSRRQQHRRTDPLPPSSVTVVTVDSDTPSQDQPQPAPSDGTAGPATAAAAAAEAEAEVEAEAETTPESAVGRPERQRTAPGAYRRLHDLPEEDAADEPASLEPVVVVVCPEPAAADRRSDDDMV